MINLYFENSDGIRSLVKENIDPDNFYYDIVEDVARRSNDQFRIFYYREFKNEKDEIVIDVGSHSEFYYLVNE